jgi:hypothetical protein
MQFKMKWGGGPKPLYRYYYPAVAGAETAASGEGLPALRRRVWRMLPLRVTAMLGDLIYRRL